MHLQSASNKKHKSKSSAFWCLLLFAQNGQHNNNNHDNNNLTLLMDGDKISVLIGHFLQTQLAQVYSQQSESELLPKITRGVVQTAYANGASTDYLQVCNICVIYVFVWFEDSLFHACLYSCFFLFDRWME